MYRPDDNDIDRLSRDAAEHYHAPGQPAWDALQQILDKELPQETEKKRRGFFFLFLLLMGISVAGTGIWYGIKMNSEHKAITFNNKTHSDNKPVTVAKKISAKADPSGTPHNTTASAPASDNDALPQTASTNPGNTGKNKTTGAANAQPATHANDITGNNTRIKNTKSIAIPAAKNNNEDAGKLPVHDNNITGNYTRTKNSTFNNTPAASTTGFVKSTGQLTASPVKNNLFLHTGRNNKKIKSDAGADDATPGNNTGNRASVSLVSPPGKNQHQHNSKIKKGPGDYAAIKKNGLTSNTNASETPVTPVATTDESPATKVEADKDNTKDEMAVSGKNIIPPPAAADTISSKHASVKTIVPNSLAAKTEKKDSAKLAKKKNKSKNDKAINIGLTAGLDLSTVKYTHGDNAGYNFGIMGGYQFNKHWSVYTGVIYTKKNYELNGADYHPPKHYWTQYVTLQTVEGYCRMWEVPLLARYTFNPDAKTAFFVSTGISSYFMKKQAYNYSYKDMMGNPGMAAWSNDSSFNHVFSILHLSAGFEKSFGKHMNWQIEPYAKIPLGGVGFGDIRLSSFGVNLTVQYRQPLKR